MFIYIFVCTRISQQSVPMLILIDKKRDAIRNFLSHCMKEFLPPLAAQIPNIYEYNFILSAYHKHIRPPPQAIKVLTKHSIMLQEMAATKRRKFWEEDSRNPYKTGKHIYIVYKGQNYYSGNIVCFNTKKMPQIKIHVFCRYLTK